MREIVYQQKDYYINDRYNQYSEIISIIENELKKHKDNPGKQATNEALGNLKTSLEENRGENLEPWEVNAIIRVLLINVPEEMKTNK